MDPVTHGLIGASASQSFAARDTVRPAAFVGFISAMLPDLDVLIGSSSDPLLNLELHRQFTHAFIFIPAGAFIAAGLLWWLVRKKLSFGETYLFCLLGYATAGIADTFTSYGVQLLWPFTGGRFAWNLISVFDPLFSLVIILTAGYAFYSRKRAFAWLAFGWIALYLLFALAQQEKSKTIALDLAEQRGHPVRKLIVKPTLANELLWSIRYVSGDRLYADGVRLMPFSEPRVYEGTSTPLAPWRVTFAHIEGSTAYRDIKRFAALSDGVLISHPDEETVLGDGRYAMLPTSVAPLWGIEPDTLKPHNHVDFNTYRDASEEVLNPFKNMLLGRSIDQPPDPQ